MKGFISTNDHIIVLKVSKFSAFSTKIFKRLTALYQTEKAKIFRIFHKKTKVTTQKISYNHKDFEVGEDLFPGKDRCCNYGHCHQCCPNSNDFVKFLYSLIKSKDKDSNTAGSRFIINRTFLLSDQEKRECNY